MAAVSAVIGGSHCRLWLIHVSGDHLANVKGTGMLTDSGRKLAVPPAPTAHIPDGGRRLQRPPVHRTPGVPGR